MKKVLALVLLALPPRLFATTFFSGETGAAAIFSNGARDFAPALNLEGFLTGQFAFSNFFSVRGEFSLHTNDMNENGLTKEVENTVFQINEISGTLTRSFLGGTHSFSLFNGHFETIGSQQFISRHLGVKNYSSRFCENYRGQIGSIIYPVYGIGGLYSYTFKDRPISAGLGVSKIKQNLGDTEDFPQINIDLRLAIAYRLVKMDFLFGIGAPLKTKTTTKIETKSEDDGDENEDVYDEKTESGTNETEQDVFLLIDTLYFHTGIDLLLGESNSFFSLYIQYGLEYFPLKDTENAKYPGSKEIHLLVEPRFNFGALKFHITAFSFPSKSVEVTNNEKEIKEQLKYADKLLLLDEKETLGANISIFADNLYAKSRKYGFGFNIMGAFEEKHFNDVKDNDFIDSLKFKVCPFVEFEANGGKLKLMLQANVSNIIKNDTGSESETENSNNSKNNPIKFHIGYKRVL